MGLHLCDIISELLNLEENISSVDLVITGEGKMDEQTAYGKTPVGISRLAKKHGVPVIGIAWALGSGYEVLYQEGFSGIFSIINRPMSLEEALNEGGLLIESLAENLGHLLTLDLKTNI